MFRFLEDYPGASEILLGTNYRSTGFIVRNSLKIIRHNKRRFEKKLETSRGSGSCLHIQELSDPAEEAGYILDEIEKRIEDGVKPEDIAVLFRVHTDAGPLAEAFVERGMPFQMKEHLPNIYNHFIGKDIQAYFRLAAGGRERKDFLQVMNRPKRYLGRDSLSGRTVSFEDMRTYYCDKEWMLDRIDQFEWDLKMLGKMAPYAAIQYLRKRIGYDDYLKDYAYARNIQRADLTGILDEIAEASRPYKTLEEWFRHVEEYTRVLQEKEKKKQEDPRGVRLMTIHAAKGLEFHSVFIMDANEGRMPYKKARTDAQTEEERRLFYVAMTRAKENLTVCYVKTKSGKDVSPSRFVDELLDIV